MKYVLAIVLSALLCVQAISSPSHENAHVTLQWPIIIDNKTSHRLLFYSNFPEDWFNPFDGMQVNTKPSETNAHGNISINVPTSTKPQKVAGIYFMTYGDYPGAELSNHMLIFTLKDLEKKKVLCKIAFLGNIQGEKVRISKVLSNDINCRVTWKNNWHHATKDKSASDIVIVVKEILNADRQ